MSRVEEVYAFVAEGSGPDDEGIVGLGTLSGFLPLVTADVTRVETLRPIARSISERTGTKVKLLHFTQREELGDV